MGKLVNLLSTGVGLAAEVVNSRMDNRLPSQRQQSQPTRPSASTYMISNSQQYMGTRGIDSTSRSFPPATYDMQIEQQDCEFGDLGAPPPDYYQAVNRTRLAPTSQPQMGSPSSGRLPYPVIIPQRRPEDKSRGWMLAYAPVLNDFGIDQATFLKFLIDFNESHKVCIIMDLNPSGRTILTFWIPPTVIHVFGCRQFSGIWCRFCAWYWAYGRFDGCSCSSSVCEENTNTATVRKIFPLS